MNQSHEQYDLVKTRHMTAMELLFLPGEIRKNDGDRSDSIEDGTHRYSNLRFTGFSEKMQTSSIGRKRRAIISSTLIVNYGVTLEVDSKLETRTPMRVFNDTIKTNNRLLEDYGLEFFQVVEEGGEDISTSSGALSTGAWIGIGIAIAMVVIAIIAGIMYYRKTKTRKSWYANAANDFSKESSKKEEEKGEQEDDEVSGNDSDVESEVGSAVSDQIVDARI